MQIANIEKSQFFMSYGMTHSLKLKFSGNPTPIVEWAHNGNLISTNTSDFDFVQTASTLVLTAATREV